MNSLQRVLTTLGRQEPDRVPFFLLATLHGARELGLSIRDYFSKPEYVVEGQIRLQRKYRHDCLCPFFYAALEVEAWGGEVIFYDDGPPNAGTPILPTPEAIRSLEPPVISGNASFTKVLESTAALKLKAKDEIPIIGVVISPFSLPVMQMGFEAYLRLLLEAPELHQYLMRVNEEHCAAWAAAQVQAGATAICYFDPMSSTTMVPRQISLEVGLPIAKRTLTRIPTATAIHLASGRCLSIIEELAQTGAVAVGVSTLEDLAELKAVARGRLSLLGNLNTIEMRRWSPVEAEQQVKTAIAKAGPGGGFILGDNHGEIPFQVPEDVLLAISEAVFKWGNYPLTWTQNRNA